MERRFSFVGSGGAAVWSPSSIPVIPEANFLQIGDLVRKLSCPGSTGRQWPVERWIPDS